MKFGKFEKKKLKEKEDVKKGTAKIKVLFFG